MSLFHELKRRNVFRVGIAYAASAWIILQITDVVGQLFELPTWGGKLILLMLMVGFFVALMLAWAYELTPEGVKLESKVTANSSLNRRKGRILDRTIIALLLIAVSYFVADKFLLREVSPAVTEPGSPPTTLTGNEPSTSRPERTSVAVLPLEPVGQDTHADVFSIGIQSGLITELAQISGIRVVSRASAKRAAERDLGLKEIASLLNVSSVLAGEIQRSGDLLRVNLQLVDVATDTNLWANTFDRNLSVDSIFTIQDEIARAVTGALKAELTAADEARLGEAPTRNFRALEFYFQGMALREKGGSENLQNARISFRRAREVDPGFARALAAEAISILLLPGEGSLGRPDAMEASRPLVERALLLAPSDPLVLAAQGQLLSMDFRYAEAVDRYRRSLAVNPIDSEVITWLQRDLRLLGKLAELENLLRQAVEIDPISSNTLFAAATGLSRYADSDPAEIAQLLRQLERVDPKSAWRARGRIALERGDWVGAVTNYQEAVFLDPDSDRARLGMAWTLSGLGMGEQAAAVNSNMFPTQMALRLGDFPRALVLGQEAIEFNPQAPTHQLNLAEALWNSGQHDEALRLQLLVWESTGENPYMWPAEHLANMAWGGRISERESIVESFSTITRQRIDAAHAAGLRSADTEVAAAKLAALEGRLAEGLEHLERAVDLGYRNRHELDSPSLSPLAALLEFRKLIRRLDGLLAEERRQALEIVCSAGGLLAVRHEASEACAAY